MSKKKESVFKQFADRSKVVLAVAAVAAIATLLWAVQTTSHAKAKMATLTSGSHSLAKAPNLVLPYVYKRIANPAQTVVTDQKGTWVATFTDKAYTVRLVGDERVFAEPDTTKATVTSNTWVRVLPRPFTGSVDEPWLNTELADTSPDILAAAMQYIAKAPVITSNGIQIAGDASYGPLTPGQTDGVRAAGSDFNDYLGIDWRYGAKVDHPEPAQTKSLDCSGYMRMVWGYRAGLPLAPTVSGTAQKGTSDALSRRAAQLQDSAPGIVLIDDSHVQVTDFSKLAIGDIVFFDANAADGTKIDHVGMYLGVDSEGHNRFISSRKTADGPTMGDVGGKSILDGSGHYATALRAARRF